MQSLFTSINPPGKFSNLNVLDLGIQDYRKTHPLQLELLQKRKKDEIEDTLILVEHPDVYTFGRRYKDQPIIEGGVVVERGGEGTYHNPGQLVIYPILKLQKGEQDVTKFMRKLENIVIEVLREFGIEGEQRSGATGVWVKGKNKKIASLGVALSAWVSYHGVALNVCNDLRGFYKINPCGFNADVMTSMVAEGATGATIEAVKKKVVASFK